MAIAVRGEMLVHRIDCHISYARIHRDRGETIRAQSSLAEAERLIRQTNYHRRTPVPAIDDFPDFDRAGARNQHDVLR
jgi:hypothetical protein